MDLATELQKIYDSEINVGSRGWWGGGIEVRLGDNMNRYLAEATVPSGCVAFLPQAHILISIRGMGYRFDV